MYVYGTARDMDVAKFKRVYHNMSLLVHPENLRDGKMRNRASECTNVLTNGFVVAHNWALLQAGQDKKKSVRVQVTRELRRQVIKPPGEYQDWF